MRIFVTGSGGFIGFHLVRRLLEQGHFVTGFDGMTPYYDVQLKNARVALLAGNSRYSHHTAMLEDKAALDAAMARDGNADVIVHLAAQAGVRYSLEHPESYVSSNLVGTFNVLELARVARPRHLLFASTSSVYGGNREMPFAEVHRADAPITLYAATKKAGEAMSHSYAHLWGIPTTCLRFFTVYGPWGRPDMALFKFVRAIDREQPIDVYGEGLMRRDFTYVEDLVAAVEALIDRPPETGKPVTAPGVVDSLSPVAPWRSVNIGGGTPIELLSFIRTIESCVGRTAKLNLLPMQPGDVRETQAAPGLLSALVGQIPNTSVADGVRAFVDWYRSDYSRIAPE